MKKHTISCAAQQKGHIWCLLSMISLFAFCDRTVFAQAQQSNYVPGQVMAKVNYDEVELPAGRTEVDFGQVNIRSAVLRQALQRFQINRIARVVPTAVKGDTLRILPDGTRIKLTDFFDLYLLTFPDNISVDSVVTALQRLAPVIYARGGNLDDRWR